MKRTLLVFTFLLTSFLGFSQRQGEGNDKIEALKIAFITQKLSITSAEAEKFWPIYREYESQVASVSQKEGDVLKNEEKLLNIRKKYKPRFVKVLDEKRANDLYNVEKEFRTVLIRRLKNRGTRG